MSWLQHYLSGKGITYEAVSMQGLQWKLTHFTYKDTDVQCTFQRFIFKPESNICCYFFRQPEHTIYFHHGALHWKSVYLDRCNGYANIRKGLKTFHLLGRLQGRYPIQIIGENVKEIPTYLQPWLQKLLSLLPSDKQKAACPKSGTIYVHLNPQICVIQTEFSDLTGVIFERSVKLSGYQGFFNMGHDKMYVVFKGKETLFEGGLLEAVRWNFRLNDKLTVSHVTADGYLKHPISESSFHIMLYTPYCDSSNGEWHGLLENKEVSLQAFCNYVQGALHPLTFAGKIQPDFLNHYCNSRTDYPLDWKRPLFLRGTYKNHKKWNLVFENKNLNFAHSNFDTVFAKVQHYDDKHTWQWESHLENSISKFNADGCYRFCDQTGRLFLSGALNPKITYAFKRFLPCWWVPFWNDFNFNEGCLLTHLCLDWNGMKPNAYRSFGEVYTRDFRYQNTHFEALNLRFGTIPGYIWLQTDKVKLPSGVGACELDWRYNLKQEDREKLELCGQGNYTCEDWNQLLALFNKRIPDNHLAFFKQSSQVQAKFQGLFDRTCVPSQDSTCITLHLPFTQFAELPVEDLQINLHHNSDQIQISEFTGLLGGQFPMKGKINFLDQENSYFTFNGKGMATQLFLQKLPYLKSWFQALPSETLEAYQGTLDLEVEGQGNLLKLESLKARGAFTFSNQNLAQIHLLGPLLKILPKKLHVFSSVEFDTLISKFELKNGILKSQDTNLLGPSTHAKIDGEINLLTQSLQANVTFSFLDYKQLKFPILKQVLQIFRPILNGFSAQITGTFQDPHWFYYFNPFNFIRK